MPFYVYTQTSADIKVNFCWIAAMCSEIFLPARTDNPVVTGRYVCLCLVTQMCSIPGDPMNSSPPASPVHGILQARTLEWVAMPSSRGSSWPRDWICISYVLHWQADSLPLVPPGKPNQLCILYILEKPTIFPSASESSFSELSWCLRSPTMWGFPVNKWFSETPAGYPTS